MGLIKSFDDLVGDDPLKELAFDTMVQLVLNERGYINEDFELIGTAPIYKAMKDIVSDRVKEFDIICKMLELRVKTNGFKRYDDCGKEIR